jgi:hypothetical protein
MVGRVPHPADRSARGVATAGSTDAESGVG